MVTMKNSSHCGALSYFVQQAANRQLIGMMMTNTDKFIVPFGATEAFFGTNPLAYGFPAGSFPPIIVDMATSQVAVGKVFHAREMGKAIPLDWGVDQHGKPTANPSEIVALFPFGGQKGSALAMIVDLFSGILASSAFGPHVSVMYGDYEKKRKLGHFACVIDISRFLEKQVFLQQVDQLIEEMHQLKPAEGFSSVMVPGEPETMNERIRLIEGIPVPESIYRYLTS
jgi:ureidoglycolate dehydrogenase (NAD+)